MIENFTNSALIIDDKESDIEGLRDLLDSKDVWVKHLLPKDLMTTSKPLKNRKIIFLDLYVSETSSDLKGNIAEIRKILANIIGMDYGTYGIVLWSAHTNEIDDLKAKIQLDADKYTLPAFIVGLDKTSYIKSGNFNNLLSDLDKALNENTAAHFFIQWDSLVREGKDKTIKNIYSLAKDYSTQEKDLKFILSKLAQNYTGVSGDNLDGYDLEHDAIKAFSDMLHYEVVANFKSQNSLFENKVEFSGEKEDENLIYAKINSRILLDTINLSQEVVIPGNIYEIKDIESVFKLSKIPENSIPIAIEITPPCDFANKSKVKSRLIGGFVSDFSRTKKDKFKKEYFYKEIWPIEPHDGDGAKLMIFDFRYFGSINDDELKNPEMYKVMYRAKDKLFADILQKLSSHTARLGLSVIH